MASERGEGTTGRDTLPLPTAFYQPAARWPFRLLAMVFLCCAVLVGYGVTRDALAGDSKGFWDAFGDLGSALTSLFFTVVFAWVAFTGRVPDRLWKLWWSSMGNEVPQHPDDGARAAAQEADQADLPGLDQAVAPHARWPFRIAAGLFVALGALAAGAQLRSWWQGAWAPGWGMLEDAGVIVLCLIMVWMFSGVALTGRVSDRAWQWFNRASRW
ncbi:MAG: hypothetical protein KDJ14_09430 [Xanthomonadales bacterium]|nr:hypothetical protein [Xanthomonadales bacterium]